MNSSTAGSLQVSSVQVETNGICVGDIGTCRKEVDQHNLGHNVHIQTNRHGNCRY
jgi:hypothetical protein